MPPVGGTRKPDYASSALFTHGEEQGGLASLRGKVCEQTFIEGLSANVVVKLGDG